MAENLNYEVEGSKCYGEGSKVVVEWPYYDSVPIPTILLSNAEIQANCSKYGRLYSWEAAMTACPEGWHLSSNDEWNKLLNSAGGKSIAGAELKNTTGWTSWDTNGEKIWWPNKYGFSALPGGEYSSGEHDWFSDVGEDGMWWSFNAYFWIIYNSNDKSSDDIGYSPFPSKSNMYSVRCVKNNVPPPNYGSLPYHGKTYKTVQIGNQTWMAENLNYEFGSSLCPSNNPAFCEKYGRLYYWATAMALPNSCNNTTCAEEIITPKHQGICPDGWHLPSNADWDVLIKSVSPGCVSGSPATDVYCDAATKLKATSGWDSTGYGMDNYGFKALPAGGSYTGAEFNDNDEQRTGLWWTASEKSDHYAHSKMIQWRDDHVSNWDMYKDSFASVRCLKD